MIRKAADVTLKVLPLVAHAEHLYHYEGPCRFGQGEALDYGYDAMATAQMQVKVLEKLHAVAPEGVEILEPVEIMRTDNWDNNEAMYLEAAPKVAEADLIISYNRIACDDITEEFMHRFKKPVILTPDTGFAMTIHAASLRATDPDFEVYPTITWDDVVRILKTLRARKVIQNTRILCINRFGNPTSFSSVDAFHDLEGITNRLGARFRFVNLHEFIEQLRPFPEGGNSTTPNRESFNLTDEELAEATRLADEFIAGADNVYMPRENVINSFKTFVLVRKLMDFKDCNGFTAPCPDLCSTRRAEQDKFTFCLTHSLNMEDGVPSSCEYDTDCVLSQQALIAVSGKTPYMGNTLSIPVEDGKLVLRFGITEAELADLNKLEDKSNLYYTQHSVASRNFKDKKEFGHYDIRPFALEQQFGATLKYDFRQDIGQHITSARFSPDGSKLFIGHGEIVYGCGFDRGNCTSSVIFRVADQEDWFKKQCVAGNHVPMVYGDYRQELIDLANALGVEPVVAK